jgi:hypothetical protein
LTPVLASPKLSVEGLSVVHGNCSVEQATVNALSVLELANAGHIPVAKGCDLPLVQPSLLAPETHGATGPGYAELRSRGKTVITITHDIDFCAENFERVIAMSQGKILLDGTANEVLGQEVLATTYAEPPKLTRLGKRLGFRRAVRHEEEFLESLKKMMTKNAPP